MITAVSGGPYLVGQAPNSTLIDVRRYSPDSFYNWEQDNIPIDDLITNQDIIAGIQGANLNASSDGGNLVLSGTALEASSVFSSVGSLVNRIPKLLDYPLLIEVVGYGNLGDFALEGITLEGAGALTFVNRNHANTLFGDGMSYVSGTSAASGYPWDISSLDSSINSFKSADLYGKIINASSTTTSSLVYDKASWNSNLRVFGSQHLHTNSTFQEPFFFTSGTRPFLDTSTPSTYVFSGNIYDNVYDVTVSSDSNPFEFSKTGEEPMRHRYYTTRPVAGDLVSPIYAYANYFQSIKIKDCRGAQIQFIGFCADGVDNSTSKVGFDIQNSDVVLTSCASFRNSEAGFRISDSDVEIEGGITGYRNYNITGAVFSGNRLSELYNTEDSWLLNTDGNGFEASKSTIKFDEDSDISNASGTSSLGKHGYTMASNGRNGWVFENCKVLGGVGGHTASGEQGAGTNDFQTTQLIAAFNKSDGFKIEDSKVSYKGILRAQGNEVNGVNISNSKVGVMGVVSELNNKIGLSINSSKFVYNIGADRYFTGYDTNVSSWENRAGHSTNTPAICVNWNSLQNIKIENNSSFSDSLLEHSGSRAGLVGGREGATTYRAMAAMNGNSDLSPSSLGNYERGNVPLISVNDNSYARLLGLSVIGDTSNKAFSSSLQAPVKGRAVSVTNNSSADIYGTSAFNTMISTYLAQDTSEYLRSSWVKSALYAGQSSTIRISGPTKISNFGVAALAEDNSKITIGPAISKTGYFDSSLDPLDVSGHSQVELQSTRACLVANNKSTLEMERCGAEPPTNSINNYDLSAATYGKHSGSFIQFYPHGFTEEILSVSGGKGDDINYKAKLNASGTLLRTSGGIDSANNRTNHNAVSTGGMCVRAVGGSNVTVDQVNFEVYMGAADLSGAYYNLEGSGNEGISVYAGSPTRQNEADSIGTGAHHYAGSQLMLWNISDNSRILASNLKVNGVDPSAAGYIGPPGRWGFTTNQSDPLGALDYYGPTGAYQQETGAAAGQYNYGPFRLLTGISSDLMAYGEALDEDYTASSLQYGQTLTLGGTAIHQLNAQGYAAPGLMASSVVGSDARKHSEIEQLSGYGITGQPIFGARAADPASITGLNGTAARYLVANSMMEDYDTSTGTSQLWPTLPIPPIHMEWQGYLRNFLDESAADTFANAKHGASKMIKLCSIFRSHTGWSSGGEGRDAYGNDSTYGLGVRSLNIFDLFKQI